MTRLGRRMIVGVVGLTVVALIPKAETTFEFDAVNLRLRDCGRYRSWVLGFVLVERCGPARDHPTAERLRQLGVLPAVREPDTRWVLIKGFTSGVRGWSGAGKMYVRALGPTTFGTAVPLPADEDLSANLWVRWAEKDPAAATQFWRTFQTVATDKPERGGDYLLDAAGCLEHRQLQVTAAELDTAGRTNW